MSIGVGASSAFFSISTVILLRPLPFDPAGRLVDIGQRLQPSGEPLMNSHNNLNQLRGESTTLDGVAVYQGAYGNISAGGPPEYAQGIAIDTHFFPLLGVKPIVGRSFTAEDEKDHSPCVLMPSYPFWQRRFALDPSIVGKHVLLDKDLCTVVGVLPQSFSFPFNEIPGGGEDFWIPLRDESSIIGSYDKYGIARLKAGTTLRQAQSEASLISTRITRAYKRQPSRFLLRPYRQVVVADFIPVLDLLGGVLVCFLLVVCINTSSLFLVEILRNRKDIAVRFALGAKRPQILRLFLFRVLTLSCAAGLAGTALSWQLVTISEKLFPDVLRNVREVASTAGIVSSTVALAFVTGLLSAALPALTAIRESGILTRTGTAHAFDAPSVSRGRQCLVVLQLAFTAAFLITTGLFGISLYRLLDIHPGLMLDHRMVLGLKPTDANLRTAQAFHTLFLHVQRELASVPAIQAVAISTEAPLAAHSVRDFRLKDTPPPLDPRQWIADSNAVGPNYFRVLGIQILKGRYFDQDDRYDGKPVAIINRVFANRFIGTESVVGKQLCIPSGGACVWRQIIGVVPDVRDSRIDNVPQPTCFIPLSQAPREMLGTVAFTLLTKVPPGSVTDSARKAIAHLFAGNVSLNSFTLEEMRSRQMIAPRIRVSVLGSVAAVALALAAMGVYGIMAANVEQRRREIGIRIALGAAHQRIRVWLLRKLSATLVPGIVMGVLGATVAVRYLRSSLFETSEISPAAYLAAIFVISVVAVVATFVPLRRALQSDPGEVLRSE